MTKLGVVFGLVSMMLATVGVGYGQSIGPGFPQFVEGCPFFFQPQRFPATGQTTTYAAGDDGMIRAVARLKYRDNGDGTITDQNSNLMWEKKDQTGDSPHNWNNTYTWQGTCSTRSTKVCGSDADCAGYGTCNVSGGGLTIFQWVAQLNVRDSYAAAVARSYA